MDPLSVPRSEKMKFLLSVILVTLPMAIAGLVLYYQYSLIGYTPASIVRFCGGATLVIAFLTHDWWSLIRATERDERKLQEARDE